MLASWSIARRINSGFAIVLALIAGLAVFSVVETGMVSGVFTEYRGAARQSLTLNDLIDHADSTRIEALKFRIAADDSAMTRMETLIGDIHETTAAARELFASDPTVIEELEEISGLADAYQAGFAQIVALEARRSERVAAMAESGARAGGALAMIMNSARADSVVDVAFYGAAAQRGLLLGRVYVLHYLLDNEDADIERAGKQVAGALESVKALQPRLLNPQRSALAEQVVSHLAAYQEGLPDLRAITSERNAIRADVLDMIGPEISARYSELNMAVVEHQNALGPKAAGTFAFINVTMVVVAVLAVAIGVAIAWLIGRWISGAVQGMAATMGRIAEGDLDLEVVGAGHNHALGAMAAALKVFQQTGREKIAADAAAEEARKEAEAARQAQEIRDRDAARRQEMVVEALKKGMIRLSEGDLSARIDKSVDGEFAALRDAFNDTSERLRATIDQIVETAATITRATSEISVGANDLSGRAENQAASLEEIAATMEEMSATVKKNAENAVTATEMSSTARSRADKGGEVVSQAVTAMSEIESGSGKISDIVSVIDGFAFQTNLLALNAAVEAARAGEAGKGFAVVASEVRSLAQRSADAAQDIKKLVEESATQVSDGVRLVRETGEALAEIVAGIRQVSDSITEISGASREQSAGVDEISAAISAMDEITQQNSALADKSSSSASALGEQARGLEELVSFFRGADAHPHDAAAKARADHAA